MGFQQVFRIAIGLVTIVSCTSYKGEMNDYGRFIPRNPNWKYRLIVEDSLYTSFIDTNSIYELYAGKLVIGMTESSEEILEDDYVYLSFYSDGHVYMGNLNYSLAQEGVKNPLNVNCEVAATVGRYSISDSSSLDLEFFEWLKPNRGKYVRYSIQSDSNGNLFFHKEGKLGMRSTPFSLIRTDISTCKDLGYVDEAVNQYPIKE